MQFILAPSKTMDMSPVDMLGTVLSVPIFQKDAEHIVGAIKTTVDLTALMKVSPTLAKSTREKYSMWGSKTKPAIFSYVGDVYKGFYANTLTKADLEWAQQHLWIMSGLYGALRPLDQISPYRLEMKASLKIDTHKDIYSYWGKRLAEMVDRETDDGIICVLSSNEYARPVTRYSRCKILTPTFFDNKVKGKIGTVPIYSKMMRGVMARWVIDNRIDSIEKLKDFSAQGYSYSAVLSTDTAPAFFRENPKPIFYKK